MNMSQETCLFSKHLVTYADREVCAERVSFVVLYAKASPYGDVFLMEKFLCEGVK